MTHQPVVRPPLRAAPNPHSAGLVWLRLRHPAYPCSTSYWSVLRVKAESLLRDVFGYDSGEGPRQGSSAAFLITPVGTGSSNMEDSKKQFMSHHGASGSAEASKTKPSWRGFWSSFGYGFGYFSTRNENGLK